MSHERYRLERSITGWWLYDRGRYLGIITQFKGSIPRRSVNGRWFWHSALDFDFAGCPDDGYASQEEAKAAMIAAYEESEE